MVASMASLLPFLLIFTASFISGVSSSSFSCPNHSSLFFTALQFQCPVNIPSNPPIEVDGNFIDKIFASERRNVYTAVLFYASWCPFSHDLRSNFDVLSSMFPQIDHFAIEQSSAMPSEFSRHGIHSLPTLFVLSSKSPPCLHYHGPKDLASLVEFYKKTTGLNPVQYSAIEQSINPEHSKKLIMQPWNGSSLKEIATREPYLLFSTTFIVLWVLLHAYPEAFSHLKAFWISCIPHFNSEIFGKTSQILGHALNMIDLKRVWTKLRLCKTKNFHAGAKNARVWASSLASVS